MTRRTALAITALSYSRIMGANAKVRLGMIGCGGRGRYVGKFMTDSGSAEFVAVADVWKKKADAAKAWAGADCKQFSDFRKLLELRDVDAVLVATPDHWHCIPTLLAVDAGKHVYVEKPLAHNIAEGQAMVAAAKRTGKVIQSGTQQRSATHFPEVAEIIASGELGPVHYVRVWNYTNMTPEGIGRAADQDQVPEGIDWDMYVGPAPMRRFNPLRIGPTYRWFWDYAGGTITDFGTHRFDTVNQIMGIEKRDIKGPRKIAAFGKRYEMTDAGEMPDTLQVTYDYGDFVMSYEMSNISGHGLGGRTPGMKYYNSRGELDRPHGMAFYGKNGAVFCDRIGYEVYPDPKAIPDQWKPQPDAAPSATTTARMAGAPFEPRIERRFKNTTDATSRHAQAFVAVIRDGAKCPASVEWGHLAANVAHLGNIAYKTGQMIEWDAQKERITNSREAQELTYRKARTPWTQGMPKS